MDTCMGCGKEITEWKEAPSGSMCPRCPECNAKRWEQFSNSEIEQQGAVSYGVHVVDAGDYDEDIDGDGDEGW
jgi:NAD-dependent SIR2 family protein deacetylase